jgi:hypothetical protein
MKHVGESVSSETLVDFKRLHFVSSQKTELFAIILMCHVPERFYNEQNVDCREYVTDISLG